MFDYARITDGSVVAGDAAVSGSVSISAPPSPSVRRCRPRARIKRGDGPGGALVTDNASVNRGALVQDRAIVRGQGFVTDGAVVAGATVVEGPVRGDVIVLDGHVLDDEADDTDGTDDDRARVDKREAVSPLG